jgi:hypothetical protein
VLGNDDRDAAEQAAGFLLGNAWTPDDRHPYRPTPLDWYNTEVILMEIAWTVLLLEEVEDWFFTLDEDPMAAVAGAIDLLELEGPTLGRPTVDRVKGSKYHSMKELRPAGTSVRIMFMFDPQRQAILLLGGDKLGNWKNWYDKNIPIAELRYEGWLATQGGG